MNVLPRLLFLFQTLPLKPPKSMFTIWDGSFIWQGRPPYIRYKVLQLSKWQGGWGLPHLRYNWLAYKLRVLTISISDRVDTRWLEIEKSVCTPMPLSNTPFAEDKALEETFGQWSKTTLIEWREVQQTFGWWCIGFVKYYTKRPIPNLYRAVSSMKQENTLHIKQKREGELELWISEEVWENISSESY